MKANVSATKVTQTSMVYPLTPQQFALWLLYQREPENKTYNTGFTARIVSEVNVSALRAAFQQISDRHAALRTIFLTQDGEPRQQVLDKQDIFFVQVETSISGNGSFEQELYEQVISASRQPFCLETGPLLRVYLFTQQVDQHILLISMHHIIGDGWSIDILLNELRILYPALSLGEEGELPETTTQPMQTMCLGYIERT